MLQWDSFAFEEEVASRKTVATALRRFEEWDTHPHARTLVGVPPVELIKVGDAPKRTPDTSRRRPLDGVRVLELTRVIAGPVSGRTLAGGYRPVKLSSSNALNIFFAHSPRR